MALIVEFGNVHAHELKNILLMHETGVQLVKQSLCRTTVNS